MDVNGKIRAAWSLFQPELDPVAVAAAKEKAAARYALEDKARASLPEILKQYRWDYDAIDQNSDFEFSYAYFMSRMWGPDDVVWCGDPTDTGRPEHAVFFKRREDMVNSPNSKRYTCASTFKPGSCSRKQENVETTKFLIVEGDHVLGKTPETAEEKLANKNACGAIFNWLRNGLGLNLRAVVDSGNKSLHAWYDMVSETKLDELRIVLPSLGCDRAMFKSTQPARLPGKIRENGNEQKLLWIS